MRPFIKLLGVVPLLILYILFNGTIALLPAGGRLRRAILIKNTSFFSRLMLRLLGIRVHVEHRERLHEARQGRLIVANHVSYVDVLVLASLVPSVFITSVELGSTLFLGMLARLSGCLFVERRKVSGLKNEIAMITRMLSDGFRVILFPESTTSNGDRVQPFKNSLFDAAVATGTAVLPICLRYTKINDKAPADGEKDAVFYYGEMTFFRHFPKLLSLKSIAVGVMPLEEINVHAHTSRKELAAEAYTAISAAYHHAA
ncbi:MAG: lysophospholipid acyltransferase family protein [Betaproteobacteria bacterium]